jgi:hypothetical protein
MKTFFTKQATLIMSSSALSIPLQLGFPGQVLHQLRYHCCQVFHSNDSDSLTAGAALVGRVSPVAFTINIYDRKFYDHKLCSSLQRNYDRTIVILVRLAKAS